MKAQLTIVTDVNLFLALHTWSLFYFRGTFSQSITNHTTNAKNATVLASTICIAFLGILETSDILT